MKTALLLAAAFPVGLLGPVSPRVEAEAARLGFAIVETAPEGAASASAASPSATGGEIAADWTSLRLRAALAAADGSRGFFVRLPAPPAGRDLLDFPEDWQAPARALRELASMRPVIERGAAAEPPVAAPGARSRAWRHRGRLYAVYVNDSTAPVPLDAAALDGFRALFEPRSSPREALERCGGGVCLPAGRVLWLEGRPL